MSDTAAPRFHNVTFYVTAGGFERAAAFYRDVVGLEPVFEQPGHIACFALLGYDVGLCIHEEEPAHPSGTTELFFWTDDPEPIRARASQAGHASSSVPMADGSHQTQLVDSTGVRLRLDPPPSQ